MSAQYNPNKLGWGAALATCVMTAALGFTAYTIHKNTYRHPRDPMTQQVFHAEDVAKSAEHAEHAAPAEGRTEAKSEAKPEAAEAKH